MKIGMNGSVAHVMTNDKVENKQACLGELTKEGIKDTVVLTAGTAAAVTTAANAGAIKTFFSKVANSSLKQIGTKVATVAKNVINNPKGLVDKATTALKELEPSKLVEKAKNLPKPMKAAIGVGVALFATYSAAKSGYIEGKHETK